MNSLSEALARREQCKRLLKDTEKLVAKARDAYNRAENETTQACAAAGGHIDNGGMLEGVCERCGALLG